MLRSGRLRNTVETASFTARGHLEKEKKGKSKHDGFDVLFVESETVGRL